MQLSISPISRKIGSLLDNKEKKTSRFCNCKRSSCLKLYCECFANGSYCQASKCNCNTCHNNPENNNIRKNAIESTLERNPHAFRSKIFIAEKSGGDTSTKHHKGCHCKKSNCLKKYCECFQGGVVCSERCRCLECRNFTGSSYRLDAIQRLQSKERPEGDPKLIENPYDNDRNNIGNEDSLLKDVHLQKNSTIGSSVYRNNTLIWLCENLVRATSDLTPSLKRKHVSNESSSSSSSSRSSKLKRERKDKNEKDDEDNDNNDNNDNDNDNEEEDIEKEKEEDEGDNNNNEDDEEDDDENDDENIEVKEKLKKAILDRFSELLKDLSQNYLITKNDYTFSKNNVTYQPSVFSLTHQPPIPPHTQNYSKSSLLPHLPDLAYQTNSSNQYRSPHKIPSPHPTLLQLHENQFRIPPRVFNNNNNVINNNNNNNNNNVINNNNNNVNISNVIKNEINEKKEE